jgi:hypothetical protein
MCGHGADTQVGKRFNFTRIGNGIGVAIEPRSHAVQLGSCKFAVVIVVQNGEGFVARLPK